MKLARFWSRDHGEAIGPDGPVRVVARGWSDDSIESARAKAREIAQKVAQRIVSRDPQNRYPYGERPLPEEVIERIGDSVVTRNAYGALVLNADRMMFVDIDREETPPASAAGSVLAGIFSLFGKSQSAPPVPPADPVLEEVRRVAGRHKLAGRLYKTAGGYRALISSQGFPAGAPQTEALLQEFGADPLYVRLCRTQESFRARLTPKPWRCGFYKPRGAFPFESADEQAHYRQWEAKYNAKASGYATCRFLAAFGDGSIAPAFEALIEYHDRETKAAVALPLA